MSLEEKDWKDAQTAWEKIKKQAEIDTEQADLYLKAISEKLETFK